MDKIALKYQFFSPGRINLIGEHIDYSGGLVFPCAITYGTTLWADFRSDRELHFYSENFDHLGEIIVDLDDLVYDSTDNWTNYPKGVIKKFQEAGYLINRGLDLYYSGNIPHGAGLSSSASIEMVTAWMLKTLFSLDCDMLDCVKLSQKAENQFVGVNSGIMDQFACGMGQKDKAILLNTSTLDYELIPIKLDGYSIVICNTNKRRGLCDSKYNQRRSECEMALSLLRSRFNIQNLCDLSSQQLEENKDLFDDDVIYRRARHAISENERTILATKVLQDNQLQRFGKLMVASHQSLRDDYEVTGIELDTLVAVALQQPGVLGARVTGAGFGGCAIAIVKSECVESFIEEVGQIYLNEIGYKADFYVASVGDGTHEIK